MDRRSQHPSVEQLLHADHYTPEELADLTGVGIEVIRRAVYDGEMAALVVDTDIVRISRAEALNWLARRSAVVTKETP